MTKFAQELSDAARPDWRDHYIGYERLKQLIKGLHRDIEQRRRSLNGRPARPPEPARGSAPPIFGRSPGPP